MGRACDGRAEKLQPAADWYILWYIVAYEIDGEPMNASRLQTLRQKARVLEGLGDKVLDGLSAAVHEARQDLARYREMSPDVVLQSSARGLANWIHDRLWYHTCRLLESVDGVVCYEKGALREVIVEDRYRLRVKRHRVQATVATYPTQGAMDFMEQPDGQRVLDGLEQSRLIVGYQWDADSEEMGPAVLSMRHGVKNVLWVHELPGAQMSTPQLPRRVRPDAALVRSRLAGMDDEAPHSSEA